MKPWGRAPERSTVWSFVGYALIALVPVVALGASLGATYGNEARRRGVAEGRSEATLLARTIVEPRLGGSPLASRLDGPEAQVLDSTVASAVGRHDVLRFRIRTLDGVVVYSDDGSGFSSNPEDEALDAARGETVGRLTRLNTDANDSGPGGVEAVEVYLPLNGGSPPARVGVLEVYLPYAPIEADVAAGLHSLYRDLAGGLALLYLALFLLTVSVSRRLRRQLRVNKTLAERDSLTGLPNRTLFLRRATDALERARDRRHPVAVALFDLDRFKEVNDTLGHPYGDRLLVEVARRLVGAIGPRDTVARLGGDEYGVILRDPGSDPAVELRRLRDVIAGELDVSGVPISVEASVGYAVAPEDGADVDELLQRADLAMYVAKSRHEGVTRYDRADDHYDAVNLSLVAELHRAIRADELVLHYQPKASLEDGSVSSVEALLRWQHPTRGLLAPDRFLLLAEQTDIIDDLTDWVLRTALVEVAASARDSALSVAVNVSARNLASPGFADRVVAILAETGVPAGRLIVEITETALLVDPLRAAAVLRGLAASGVRVSLDDFGSGQTSLGYLSALPLHELKIDRSFVSDALENRAHAAIVRSMADLGHNLGLTVVAEGVETDAVRVALRDAGCDLLQGYLLARPMPAGDLGRWLDERGSPRSGVAAVASLVAAAEHV